MGHSHLAEPLPSTQYQIMRALAAVTCLLLFGASACGNDTSSIVVTADDTGVEIIVSIGDRIEARLDSNPTTGYSWRLESQAVDAFTSIDPVEYEAPSDDGRVGVAGIEVFAIDIVDTGAGVLRFEYLRPFDDPPVPARVVEYIIRADGAPWPLDSIGLLPPIASDSAPSVLEDSTNPANRWNDHE